MNESVARRLLVIDDEVFVRDLLDDFFGKLGFQVVVAADGPEGIDAFQNTEFHAVLVDLKMPGMSGTETLRELRAIRVSVPVIIMTGYPTIDSSIEALRLGAYDYIIKPFKLQELRELVERAIKEQELHTEIDTLRGRIAGIEQELRDHRAASTTRRLSESSPGDSEAWQDSHPESEQAGTRKTRRQF
jgi:two-component system response regulator AtoC